MTDHNRPHSHSPAAGSAPKPDRADLILTTSGPDPAAAVSGAALSSPPQPNAGRYQMLDEIAQGGMGVIWRATDTTLGREVAIKVLQDRFSLDSGTARRDGSPGECVLSPSPRRCCSKAGQTCTAASQALSYPESYCSIRTKDVGENAESSHLRTSAIPYQSRHHAGNPARLPKSLFHAQSMAKTRPDSAASPMIPSEGWIYGPGASFPDHRSLLRSSAVPRKSGEGKCARFASTINLGGHSPKGIPADPAGGQGTRTGGQQIAQSRLHEHSSQGVRRQSRSVGLFPEGDWRRPVLALQRSAGQGADDARQDSRPTLNLSANNHRSCPIPAEQHVHDGQCDPANYGSAQGPPGGEDRPGRRADHQSRRREGDARNCWPRPERLGRELPWWRPDKLYSKWKNRLPTSKSN